jgi:hypothetical protein
VILYEEVAVDPENIKASMDWPTPWNVLEVTSFMGLAKH